MTKKTTTTTIKKNAKMITKNTTAKASISNRTLTTDGDKAFYMADGTVVYSLIDLPAVIERADDNTFTHHVNSEKNDFANWIRDVFNVSTLANKISKKTTKEALVKELKAALK